MDKNPPLRPYRWIPAWFIQVKANHPEITNTDKLWQTLRPGYPEVTRKQFREVAGLWGHSVIIRIK